MELAMYLPMQREPVERSIVGYPPAGQSRMPGGAPAGAEGPGVEPSAWNDWLVRPTYFRQPEPFFPTLGKLGI
jgi:hypothetical protein